MKRIVFLLFLFPSICLACQDHPVEAKAKPLWVQTLLKAAHAKHKDHKHEHKIQKPSKKESLKKPITK